MFEIQKYVFDSNPVIFSWVLHKLTSFSHNKSYVRPIKSLRGIVEPSLLGDKLQDHTRVNHEFFDNFEFVGIEDVTGLQKVIVVHGNISTMYLCYER